MLQRPGDAVRRGDQQQGQQRVRVVEPVHQHGGRGEREDGAGEQAGGRAGPAAHGGGEQGDGGDAFQRLRDQQAPGAEAEQPGGQAHHPQRGGRLVDGDPSRPNGSGSPVARKTCSGGGSIGSRNALPRASAWCTSLPVSSALLTSVTSSPTTQEMTPVSNG